jgi:hypothetical protein
MQAGLLTADERARIIDIQDLRKHPAKAVMGDR